MIRILVAQCRPWMDACVSVHCGCKGAQQERLFDNAPKSRRNRPTANRLRTLPRTTSVGGQSSGTVASGSQNMPWRMSAADAPWIAVTVHGSHGMRCGAVQRGGRANPALDTVRAAWHAQRRRHGEAGLVNLRVSSEVPHRGATRGQPSPHDAKRQRFADRLSFAGHPARESAPRVGIVGLGRH